MTTAIEGEPICGAEAANCVCGKDPGHVEAGDRVHVCCRYNVFRDEECNGAWFGTYGGEDFEVVAWPNW